MSCISTDFALQPQGLLLCSLRELPLERVLLATISFLLSIMMAFSLGQGSSLPSLVKGDRVVFVLLAFRAVGPDFLWDIHSAHSRLRIKKTLVILILFHHRTATQILLRQYGIEASHTWREMLF